MGTALTRFKHVVAALLAALLLALPGAGRADDPGPGSERSQRLLGELRTAPDEITARKLVRELELEWSRSGSAAMDFLLQRGREALERDALDEAAGHLTALTDHAPDFAEGWYTRAMVFFRMELYGMAMADLERTLALNPNHFGALQGVGAILESVGDTARAYKAYLKALEFNPHATEVREAVERLRGDAVGTDA